VAIVGSTGDAALAAGATETGWPFPGAGDLAVGSATVTPVEVDEPSVEADVASVQVDEPSVEADVASVEADEPSGEADIASVGADMPSEEEGAEAVRMGVDAGSLH